MISISSLCSGCLQPDAIKVAVEPKTKAEITADIVTQVDTNAEVNLAKVETSIKGKVLDYKNQNKQQFEQIQDTIINFGDPPIVRIAKYITHGLITVMFICMSFITYWQSKKWKLYKTVNRK